MPEFIPAHPLDGVAPADYNPRRIKADAFETLQESLRTLGVIKPIILNADGTIVAGHQRTKAMAAIGLTHTPAVALDGKVRRQDEIRFNLMHNSVETGDTIVRWRDPIPGTGYVEVPATEFDVERGAHGAPAVKEIARLLTKYGGWGSVVTDTDGNVIANSDYVYACQLTEVPVLVYRLPAEKTVEFARFMGVDYGEYYFEPLELKGWAQTHAQPYRLSGRRDETGQLEDRSTDLASRVYRRMVIPHLDTLDTPPRVIDFGAGRCDHAMDLAGKGWDVLAYEPHLRQRGGDHFDVRKIASQVREMGRSVARHGLFDVVVLDSVLNSVINMTFMDYVMTSVNALCADDGVLFTNARDRDYALANMKSGKAGSGRRTLEFFDENGFTASYTQGKWLMQKHHDREEFREYLERYFEDVQIVKHSPNYLHATCRHPRPLGEERYRTALAAELNMELPGGFFHGRHEAAVDAITAACVARDQKSVGVRL